MSFCDSGTTFPFLRGRNRNSSKIQACSTFAVRFPDSVGAALFFSSIFFWASKRKWTIFLKERLRCCRFYLPGLVKMRHYEKEIEVTSYPTFLALQTTVSYLVEPQK